MKTPIFPTGVKRPYCFDVANLCHRGRFFAKQSISFLTLFAFLINTFGAVPLTQAQDFYLPAPGVMVHLSPPLDPPMLKGIKVHPDNPFRFDFILDKGDSKLSNNRLKDESSKLVKYFLASLTIPEKDLWVNLSPYEKDHIIPNSFGLTEMGRDLLAEDYMLKQITASLIYPEDEIGKKFWKRIYEEAAKKYGTTNIPVNTFNKVWIVPEKAIVYENAKAGTAYVVESKLKVMLEQDYLSLTKHEGIQSAQVQNKDTNQLGSQIVREIVIPELTKEVNENKNFIQLRQVFNSLILATWYKKKIKDSILAQVYADENKVAGVNIDDPQEKEKIYQRYLKAFKKGVYNYIKDDINPLTQETIPRKYFSGGELFTDFAMRTALQMKEVDLAEIAQSASRSKKGPLEIVSVNIRPVGVDSAMNSKQYGEAKSLGVRPENLFSNLNIRPEPQWLIGMNDSEIKREAAAKGLSTNLTNLNEYRDNLERLLPYYKQMVIQLLRDYPDHNYIVLGRDADLFFDALRAAVRGTDREDRVDLLSLSAPLRERLSEDPSKAQKFIGQFIDFKAAVTGKKRYLLIDTGFDGTTIEWVNDVVRSVGGIPSLGSVVGANGRPLEGILMKSYVAYGYPQIKLDVMTVPSSLDEFRMPATIRATRSHYPRDQDWVNYVVASVSQLMPKFTDHLNDLIDDNGRLISVAFGNKLENALPPVSAVPIKSNGGRRDWLAPVHPLAAVLLQRLTVEYFDRQRTSIWQTINSEETLRNSNIEIRAGKNAGLLRLWQEGDIGEKLTALSAIITFADGGDKQAQYALDNVRRLRYKEEIPFDEKDIASVQKTALLGNDDATRILLQKINSGEDWEINSVLNVLRDCAVMDNEIAIHGLTAALVDFRQSLGSRWKILKVLMSAARLNPKIVDDFQKIRSDLIKLILPRLEMFSEVPWDINMKDLFNLLLRYSRLPVEINVREVADINTTRNLIHAMGWRTDDVIIVSVGEISHQLVKESFKGYRVLDRGKNPDAILKIELLDTLAISYGQGYANPDVRRFKFGGEGVSDEEVSNVAHQMAVGERKVIVLGSPHGGEIQDFLKIYERVYAQVSITQRPIIIVAPRNPMTTDFLIEDQSLLRKQSVLVRTQADLDAKRPFPSMEQANFLLLNTRGELMKLYKLASVTFVGRGHNIVEPARLGRSVLFEEGDWLLTNAEAKNRLKRGGGALELNERNFRLLMEDAGNNRLVGERGANVAQEMLTESYAKAAEETAGELLPFLLLDPTKYGYIKKFSPVMQEALAELAASFLLGQGGYTSHQIVTAIRDQEDFFIKQSMDQDIQTITNVNLNENKDSFGIYQFLRRLVRYEISGAVKITVSDWLAFISTVKLAMPHNPRKRLERYEQLRFEVYLEDKIKTDTIFKLDDKQRLLRLCYVLSEAENFDGLLADLLLNPQAEKERLERIQNSSIEIDKIFQTLLDQEEDVGVLKILQEYFRTRPFYSKRYDEIIQDRINRIDHAELSTKRTGTENPAMKINETGGIDSAPNDLWLSELEKIGYKMSASEFIKQIPSTGVQDFESHQQDTLIEYDLEGLIKKKMELEDFDIVIFQFGLGQMGYESRDFLKTIYKVFKRMNIDPKKWHIKLYGLDIHSSITNRVAQFLKEDFKPMKFPTLSMRFETANIYDIEEMKAALHRLGAQGVKADYVIQRNVSYPNFSLYREYIGEERITAPVDAKNESLSRIGKILKLYLPYRNIFLIVGKSQQGEKQLGTRMIVEHSPLVATANTFPADALDFVPPGTQRIGKRGQGIIELMDLEIVKQTSIARFQDALRKPGDNAQTVESKMLDQAITTKKGGIDLTFANMNLQTQNAGEGIKFHMDPAMLQQLQNAPGFVPVIINIQPMTDLKKFLGVESI